MPARRIDREGPIHQAVLSYLRLRFPRGLVVHAANELDMAGQAAARQVAKARHRGMVKGFPDLMLLTEGKDAMFFEVKAPGGRVSVEQRAVLDVLEGLGFRAAVVRSVSEVEALLNGWGVV